MMVAINIRPATPADLPQLEAIAAAADSAAHWTRRQWQDIFHTQIPARLAWIACSTTAAETGDVGAADGCSAFAASPAAKVGERDAPAPERLSPQAIGFLVAQCGTPEWELENMAVLPAFRRQGVGAALLSTLLEEARARRAERILLEVRVSNCSAIRLYGQGGFQPLARRPGYYQNPAEDALILMHGL
jgi:ribosomal-protein-alanine acetyltransferase